MSKNANGDINFQNSMQEAALEVTTPMFKMDMEIFERPKIKQQPDLTINENLI